MLELFRGCTRGCRFCQAGISYRPVRERTADRLRTIAKEMLDNTGYNEMSLTSLSSADYTCLGEIVDDLMEDYKTNVYLSLYHLYALIVSLLTLLIKCNKSAKVV